LTPHRVRACEGQPLAEALHCPVSEEHTMDLNDLSRSCSFLDETEPTWSPIPWHRAQVVSAPTAAPDLDTLFARLLGESPAQVPAPPVAAPAAPSGLDAPGEPSVFTELDDLDVFGTIELLDVQMRPIAPMLPPVEKQEPDIWQELSLEM
jgi:hypothetical protein